MQASNMQVDIVLDKMKIFIISACGPLLHIGLPKRTSPSPQHPVLSIACRSNELEGALSMFTYTQSPL